MCATSRSSWWYDEVYFSEQYSIEGGYMCDTMGIGAAFTGSEISIFGKNSDREADEAQLVQAIPRKSFPERQNLQCTYITIPQAVATNATVISKPFWIWGAEMGVNEKGVAMGNEALFTRVKPEKKPGLIGMDLLRLALERAATAEEAAQTIIDLLGAYGQAGPCGYRDKKFSYMNSFLIMDRACIITLETVGRDYAMKHHANHAAISNGITITADWDRSSFPKGTDLRAFTDPLPTFFAGSVVRKGRNDAAILNAKGPISAIDVFQMLRAHNGRTHSKGFNRDVCMHASDPLIRRSQTTGAMVVELHADGKLRIFVTAGSAPCLTPFKPFMPAVPFEDAGRGGGCYSDDSYWWRHEQFHLSAILRYDAVRTMAEMPIMDKEAKWVSAMPAHEWDNTEEALVEVSHKAFVDSEGMEKDLIHQMGRMERPGFRLSHLFLRYMAGRSGVPVV
jgi:secernin